MPTPDQLPFSSNVLTMLQGLVPLTNETDDKGNPGEFTNRLLVRADETWWAVVVSPWGVGDTCLVKRPQPDGAPAVYEEHVVARTLAYWVVLEDGPIVRWQQVLGRIVAWVAPLGAQDNGGEHG